MGRQKKAEIEEEADDVGTHKIKRELTTEEIEERRDQLADAAMASIDLEEKRRTANQKINVKIKETKASVRRLAQEVREGFEWVDAQMTLEEAAKARKAVVRSVQPPAP